MVTDEASRRIVGQLVPPGAVHVTLLAGDDEVADETTDRLGRFSFDPVAPGPVRIAVTDPDGTHVVTTEWVLL